MNIYEGCALTLACEMFIGGLCYPIYKSENTVVTKLSEVWANWTLNQLGKRSGTPVCGWGGWPLSSFRDLVWWYKGLYELVESIQSAQLGFFPVKNRRLWYEICRCGKADTQADFSTLVVFCFMICYLCCEKTWVHSFRTLDGEFNPSVFATHGEQTQPTKVFFFCGLPKIDHDCLVVWNIFYFSIYWE